MELASIVIVVIVVIIVVKLRRSTFWTTERVVESRYFYARKQAIMTDYESKFYKRLEAVVDGRYYIFPQIHLSALLVNKTGGRYHHAAFQKINHKSVDYVLCDKQTMAPVYAIELDDYTHDRPKRQQRDANINTLFEKIDLPLIRFRNIDSISDGDIVARFESARSAQDVIGE